MRYLKLKLIILLTLSILFLMSSCITSYETNYLQAIPEDYNIVDYQEYKLQIRDNLGCQIYTNDPEVQRMYQDLITNNAGTSSGISLLVYDNGNVILPFFGSVNVVNLTIQEAEMKIQNKLRESFNDIQVKLIQLNNNFYIYSGSRTGRYRVYKENMTIFQALAISGQTTANMDISKVKILRKDANGQDIIKEFDLRSKDIIQSEFYFIKPNDQIVFATSEKSFFNISTAQSFSSVVLSPLIYLFVVLKLNN